MQTDWSQSDLITCSAVSPFQTTDVFQCLFLFLICSFFFACLFPVDSYFMSNSKAVLQRCTDGWTLQQNQRVPKLLQMTVCLDMRLLTAGKWMAFSYTIPHSPYYGLTLQGDNDAVYVWLMGVKHRFPVRLTLEHWHRLCLRFDSLHNRFSLSVSSSQDTYVHTVIAHAMQPIGRLKLGCQPWQDFPRTNMAKMELYLFRMWGDVREHALCEDGTIVGWDSSMWRINQAQARVQDDTLYCGEHNKHVVLWKQPNICLFPS